MSLIRSNRNDIFSANRLIGIPSFESTSNVGLFSVRSRYQIPLVTTVTIARNNNDFSGGLSEFKFTMAGVRFEYFFLNRTLQTYFLTNFTSASGVAVTSAATAATPTAITDYNRTTLGIGGRFEISRGQFVALDGSLGFFADNGQSFDFTTQQLMANPSFTDKTIRFLYEKRF
jgi:hypothetical protein